MTIQPIETHYAGHRFRSRLEARWAVFFDALNIKWRYEPQGFMIPRQDGTRTAYLPDFLLTECGTWVEIKGSDAELDRELMRAAAVALPGMPYEKEPGPRLMIVGDMPAPAEDGDWGWISLGPDSRGFPAGFAGFYKNSRPWEFYNATRGDASWLTPWFESADTPTAAHAYRAARSARFEHGERGPR